MTQLGAILDKHVTLPSEKTKQNPRIDNGYPRDQTKKILKSHGNISHVKERGKEIKNSPDSLSLLSSNTSSIL